VSPAARDRPRQPAGNEINLRATLECGQVFHWRERPAGVWEGLIGERLAVVREDEGRLRILTGERRLVRRYFSMDHDLVEIGAGFPRDPVMLAALEFCRGLRMIRQPAWECLATFITSSMKQVTHIRQMSQALRARFGGAVEGTDLRSYPRAEALAGAPEAELRACGLGYRAPNLRATAERIASGGADLEAWARLGDGDLREALCSLPGVGRKVANCVMLFGFGRLAAFPVDTWIQRVLQQHYWQGRGEPTPKVLEARLASRFGPHAGYAQQYLFHHARQTQPRRRRR
jgi:N-glycosylase/DNA lyase